MSEIHATAVIDSSADVHPSAEIGPYAVVGPHVRLGEDVVLRPHALVTGYTEVGGGTQIFSFASVGEVPQDLKYKGEPTRLVIGARNTIREYVSIHPGIPQGGGLTTVGDENLLMIGAHIGHDCQVGSHTVITNNVQLAGHVIVEDWAVLGANAAVLQFCRIGESSFLAASAGVNQDVAPFAWAMGFPARLFRINRINLERREFSSEQIEAVERAFRIVFRSKLRPAEAFARVREELPDSREAEHMVAFLEKSERGFARVR